MKAIHIMSGVVIAVALSGAQAQAIQSGDVLVCGESPTPTERSVFVALPDPSVDPEGAPFVSAPVLQVCDVDTITWYGPPEFELEFSGPAGPPVDRVPDAAAQQVEQARERFSSNGKGKLRLKVQKDAEKHKDFKYSVTVPGHTPLDPVIIIRNGH